MPVLDEVVFGPAPDGAGELTYGDVRRLQSDGEKIQALRSRLDAWLVGQMTPIAMPQTRAPFPLAVMTCVAVETLGQVLFGDSFDEGAPDRSFKEMLKKVDGRFPRPPSKEGKEAFEQSWGQKPESYSEIVYSFFRNTLVHGYRSQAVFLTEEISDWDFQHGYLRLNPFWFWTAFLAAYHRAFESLLKSPNSKEFRQTLDYFRGLVS